MPRYIVTVTAKFPAAGETPGTLEIDAPTKAKAISEARAHMRREMLVDQWTGGVNYTARLDG